MCRGLCLQCFSQGSLHGWLFLISQASAEMYLFREAFLVYTPFGSPPFLRNLLCHLSYFYVLCSLVATWEFLVIDIHLWLSVSPPRMGVSQGQGQGLLCFLTFLQSLISHRSFKNIGRNECCSQGLWTPLPEGFSSAEEQAPGSICPPSCAEWAHQMGKERSTPEAWRTLANKHPKWAVNALGAAKEARYAAYLMEGQFGGYFCS